MITIFGQQCELSGDQVVVKAKTDGDCVQNPSDPDATSDAPKGPGYQVQIAETCVPENEVQLITAALPQTACASETHAATPMLDPLEDAGRRPDELLADTLDTGDENVEAAAARGVDLIGPVPGRVPESAPEALTVDDFALDERTGMIDACPAGHRPTSCSRDAETSTTRVEMPASACDGCPFRKQCPIKETRDGEFVLEFTDKERRLAARRLEEATDVFRERYAPWSGIESTNSGLKNPAGFGEPEGARHRERVAGAPAQVGGLEHAAGVDVEETEGLGGFAGGRNARDRRSRAIRRPFPSLGKPCRPRCGAFSAGSCGPIIVPRSCWRLERVQEHTPIEFCR